MLVAKKYFNVAEWHISDGVLPEELKQGRWVAKALTGAAIGAGKCFFVKEVDPTALDFIRKDGELWFLELNPNGQWAWLDLKNENGLISMIADAIKEEDARHQRQMQYKAKRAADREFVL